MSHIDASHITFTTREMKFWGQKKKNNPEMFTELLWLFPFQAGPIFFLSSSGAYGIVSSRKNVQVRGRDHTSLPPPYKIQPHLLIRLLVDGSRSRCKQCSEKGGHKMQSDYFTSRPGAMSAESSAAVAETGASSTPVSMGILFLWTG